MAKDLKDSTVVTKRLASDMQFYNNVFKKTEKLVSVAFYVLSHIEEKDSSNVHYSRIKDKSLAVHEAALRTLQLHQHEVQEGLVSFQFTLLTLDSTLRLAEAARAIPNDVFALLINQIDAVQRYINNHYDVGGGYELAEASLPAKSTSKKAVRRPRQTLSRTQIPAGDISTDAYMVYSQLTDRAERIKTVLEAKPQATIKDVSEVITDVSEKTIQRELNSLIEKGQVIREGERRWSRYSIKK